MKVYSNPIHKLHFFFPFRVFPPISIRKSTMPIYGHENEMYKEGVSLKRGKDVCMRELRECGGRTEDKTKCAKG